MEPTSHNRLSPLLKLLCLLQSFLFLVAVANTIATRHVLNDHTVTDFVVLTISLVTSLYITAKINFFGHAVTAVILLGLGVFLFGSAWLILPGVAVAIAACRMIFGIAVGGNSE